MLTGVVQWAPDLVEAYVRAGRSKDAEGLVETFHRHALEVGRAWPLATAARCRGLLADEGEFASLFDDALAHHVDGSPFEGARTELVYGERLRRARRRVEAREHLQAAAEAFDRLGAIPWSARARAELGATGASLRPPDPAARDELTPQELQVALIVAEGKTNREAAAALFLSTKTVEFHLHNAFRKLGVRSRTELARLVASDDPVFQPV